MPRRRTPAAARRLDESEVVITTRVRLARNFADAKFPQWASDKERRAAMARAERAILAAATELGYEAVIKDVMDNPGLTYYLRDNRFISDDLITAPDGAGYAMVSPHADPAPTDLAKSVIVMINEEDHFRIQSFSPGYDLDGALQVADSFDTALSRHVPYAFSKQYGYLTSCPSNLGTGLRASVMVSLPGLMVANETEPTFRAVERLGFNVRGMFGEGTKSSAPQFIAQISNRGTLGLAERDVIESLRKVVDEVVRVERQARRRVFKDNYYYIADEVSRSLGTLMSSIFIDRDEFMSAIYMIKFGVETGIVTGVSARLVDSLVLLLSSDPFFHGVGGKKFFKTMNGHFPDDGDRIDAARALIAKSALEKATVELGSYP